MPAIILTETTTITTGFGQTADLTVTVDDTGGEYLWNYHLTNVSVNYATPTTNSATVTENHANAGGPPGDPEQGIGLFRIQTAPDSVDVSTLGSTSGWSVYVGDASENNGLVQWAAGEWGTQLLTGQSFDFWFETDPVDIVDSTATFADAGFAMPADGPAKAPGEKPTVELHIDGQVYEERNQGAGRRVRINDNFDENQVTADGAQIYADWRHNPISGQAQIISTSDFDLVGAGLELKSTAMNWTVSWTVDSSVKVYYREWRNVAGHGDWKLVTGEGITGVNEGVPNEIRLYLEGVLVKSGADKSGIIKAELKVNGNPPLASDTARVQVYSGLGVTGPFASARSQIEMATGWTLWANSGAMWRSSADTRDLAVWQVEARTVFAPIFESHIPTVFENVVADATKNKLVRWDSFSGFIDSGDYAVTFDFDKRVGSAYLAHAWHEQYLKQVHGITDYNVAHRDAMVVEAKILVGSGTRKKEYSVGYSNSNLSRVAFEYDGGLFVIFVIRLDEGVNFSSFEIRQLTPGEVPVLLPP